MNEKQIPANLETVGSELVRITDALNSAVALPPIDAVRRLHGTEFGVYDTAYRSPDHSRSDYSAADRGGNPRRAGDGPDCPLRVPTPTIQREWFGETWGSQPG